MCDHVGVPRTYLPCLSKNGYIVLMCECGALVDLSPGLRSSQRYRGSWVLGAMKPEELTALVEELVNERKEVY